ncbi:unnamed protein product [Effrenium voratum]|uniref:TIGR02300 family protein n=1 Tax=Effrenium voratum TaxID=2562239 RepID=A0AA36IPL9_9DINO|nr:unnamed protein product [Effrenium voratum]
MDRSTLNTLRDRCPAVAKPDLGTKRVCPETGRKFYDLNKDPIVSPYTGKSYPLSFFEDDGADVVEAKPEKVKEDVAETTEEETETEGPEVLSLEDADEENAEEGDDNLPDLGDNTDDEVLDDDEEEDDTFLPSDDEDEDDVSGIVEINPDEDD